MCVYVCFLCVWCVIPLDDSICKHQAHGQLECAHPQYAHVRCVFGLIMHERTDGKQRRWQLAGEVQLAQNQLYH